MRGADGDGGFGVSWVVDGLTLARSHSALDEIRVVPVAGVSRRGDDHDSGTDEARHLNADGTLAAREPGRIYRVSDGQVDAVDLELSENRLTF